jgi:hypothetical protein
LIDSSGNVGINTTTPQNTLNVVGDINFTGLIYGNGSQLTDIGGGGMSSFILGASSGTNQTITDGNTALIEAGNAITTTGAATDKVTVAVAALSIDDAEIVQDSIDDTEIAADAITNSELGANSVDLTSNALSTAYAGTGIGGGGASALSFAAADVDGTCLTGSGTTLNVTDDCIGNTQLEFDTGQALATGSSPTFAGLTLNGNLDMNNKSIVDVWKLTLNVGGAIDPPYRVGDTVYSTYAPFMVGTKEEVSGTVMLTSDYIIDFKNLEKGSDLWLFYQVTDFGNEMENLQVILTPSFNGNVWYQKNPAEKTLTIHGSQAGEVSYRMTANGWNWRSWSNVAKDLDLNDYLDMGEKK